MGFCGMPPSFQTATMVSWNASAGDVRLKTGHVTLVDVRPSFFNVNLEEFLNCLRRNPRDIFPGCFQRFLRPSLVGSARASLLAVFVSVYAAWSFPLNTPSPPLRSLVAFIPRCSLRCARRYYIGKARGHVIDTSDMGRGWILQTTTSMVLRQTHASFIYFRRSKGLRYGGSRLQQ